MRELGSKAGYSKRYKAPPRARNRAENAYTIPDHRLPAKRRKITQSTGAM